MTAADALLLTLWVTALLALCTLGALVERCPWCPRDWLAEPPDYTPPPEVTDWRERTWLAGEDYGYERSGDA